MPVASFLTSKFSILKIVFKTLFILLFLFLSWCFTPKAVAQSVLQNFQTAVGDSLQATVIAPAGIIEDNLLVVGLALEKGNAVTITPPIGWKLIRRTNNGSDCGIATYYKIASASEPGSYSFALSTSGKWSIGISRLSLVSLTTPIDTSSGATGSAANVAAPSLITRGPNRRILCFYVNKKGVTFTPASSTTEIYDAPNSAGGVPSNMMADFVQNITGPTPVRTATPLAPEKWVAQQVAITSLSLLPVELIDFKAVQCENNNKPSACISWVTATETNNDFFTVERSISGINWEGIATVDGAGNSSSPLRYSIEDPFSISGTVYYRLRQTDFDGTTTFSLPLAILMKPLKELVGFPNPASRNIRLSGDFPSGVLLVRLMDVAGKLVHDKSIERAMTDASGELNINLPELPAGAYVLLVNAPDGILHQQLRIQLQ